MPEKTTVRRARRDLRQGKRPATAAGEFVREEMDHLKEGKHGARSRKQAIAIGLSKARRSGVPLKAPARGKASPRTRASAERDLEVGKGQRKPRVPSARRSRAVKGVLKRERNPLAAKRATAKKRTTTAAKKNASRRTRRR